MVKKWIDAGDIFSVDYEIEDKQLIKLMQEIPNFDKRDFKSEGAKKVYEKDGYIILKMKRGYIAYNTKKEFSEGHSHLYSFQMAKTIIDNCIRKKKPRTDKIYLLNSHIRLSNDDRYKMFIEEIITAKKGKEKVRYINVNSKKVR